MAQQTTLLGKVSLTPKGEYNASTDYERLDVISYNGGSYLALDSFKGTPPSGDNKTTMLLAAPGATGKTAYQYAHEAGYTGTEQQFAADLAAVDGLDKKADLDKDGYLVPTQFSPLQGLQTGIVCNQVGVYGGFQRASPTSSKTYGRTFEFLLDLEIASGLFYRQSPSIDEGIAIQTTASGLLYARLMGAVGVLCSMPLEGTFHVVCVVSEKGENGLATITGYINGCKTSSLEGLGDNDLSNVPQHIAYYTSIGLKKPIRMIRIFDRPFTDEQVRQSWNNGKPYTHVANDPDLKLELLPVNCFIQDDDWSWIDSSGNGNHFGKVGNATPRYDYSPLPDLMEKTIDTGVFYTDITSGVSNKNIMIPLGYRITGCFVKNLNYDDLTDFALIWRAASEPERHVCKAERVLGSKISQQFTQLPILENKPLNGDDYSRLVLTVSGNTPSGGMQVIVKLQYVGI